MDRTESDRYSHFSQTFMSSLNLAQPPIAVSFAEVLPSGIREFSGRVAAGCKFWQEAAAGAFSTSASDHSMCAVGIYTHNLEGGPGYQAELQGTLQMFEELGYLRKEDVGSVPVLAARPKFIVYSPLSQTPQIPDVVLLFVHARQSLVLSEAAQQIEGQNPPAMGRPACAVVPWVMNSGHAAFSFGCCGARAYLDVLTDETAIFAIPGSKLDLYLERIVALTRANTVLSAFHQNRRSSLEAEARSG